MVLDSSTPRPILPQISCPSCKTIFQLRRRTQKYCSEACFAQSLVGNSHYPIRPVGYYFWPKVDASGHCWEWVGAVSPQGYGQLRVRGVLRQATHVAWELLIGPCPNGLVPDHLCQNRRCVNVGEHIEWVTYQENILRGYSSPARNARKTHCLKGHAFTLENTLSIPSRAGRICKICRDKKNAHYNELKSAARKANS